VIAHARISLDDLVDPRVGIIRSCNRVPKARDEPSRPFVYQAILSNFDFRQAPAERIATGKAMDEMAAVRGAIVEALERYCAFQGMPEALVRARAEDLGAPAIAPDELVLYSSRQYEAPGFPHRRPDADDELTWVRATEVDTGRELYAPASLVYMGFAGSRGDEAFAPSTSNGLAGGPDLAAAVVGGLYELIERDAFMITWLNRLPAPRIDVSSIEGPASEIARHYRRLGVELIAFDLTTDVGVPVVMAVTLDRAGNLPAVSVGLGCHASARMALERAATEVVQIRGGTVPAFRSGQPPRRIERYEDVKTIEDHGMFAAAPEYLSELDFLLHADTSRPLDEDPAERGAEQELAACAERLRAAGCTVAFVDLTLPDVDAVGVRIVRAIATGLQPIHFGFGEERLGGSRVFAVPRLLGHRTTDSDETELNLCPHPLP
jgi:ribosomal protein S12 methylthiotransferase accessory factor